jgi:acyl-[acyl-carrier-protein]-phospholipid O-acyltransferase / long-chain-fatty-acid--[acyl-carrier-protein] ligase
MRMILPGMSGITLATAALFVLGLSYELVMLLLVALGISAGFFVVPINALIQNRPKPEVKGRVTRASNLLSFGGIAPQPLVQYAMPQLAHPYPGHVFLICSFACMGMGFVLARILPELWPSALHWTGLRQRASL